MIPDIICLLCRSRQYDVPVSCTSWFSLCCAISNLHSGRIVLPPIYHLTYPKRQGRRGASSVTSSALALRHFYYCSSSAPSAFVPLSASSVFTRRSSALNSFSESCFAILPLPIQVNQAKITCEVLFCRLMDRLISMLLLAICNEAFLALEMVGQN